MLQQASTLILLLYSMLQDTKG